MGALAVPVPGVRAPKILSLLEHWAGSGLVFHLSKKWKKRLRRVKGVAIKVGITVAGAALAGVTGGASAVLAAAALAALQARDKIAAAKASREAAAKVAAGQNAAAALMEAVAQNQADLNTMIKGVLDGSQAPMTQDPGTQQIIGNALGFGPMPGTQGPPLLETLGVALGVGGLVLIAGGPLIVAGLAAGAGALADRTGIVAGFFKKIRGA